MRTTSYLFGQLGKDLASKQKKLKMNCGYSSWVKHLSSMHEALASSLPVKQSLQFTAVTAQIQILQMWFTEAEVENNNNNKASAYSDHMLRFSPPPVCKKKMCSS